MIKVAFIRHLHLAQSQAVLARPGADQIARVLARVDGAPGRLAIERDDLACARRQGGAHALGPGGESLGKGGGIEHGKEPVERVVAGRSAGQEQERAQPALAQPGKVGHVVETLPAGEQRADRDDEQVHQAVFLAALDARVGQNTKGFQQADGIGHPLALSAQPYLTPASFVHLLLF